MASNIIDAESLRTILAALQEDVHAVNGNRKGKAKADAEITDNEVAFQELEYLIAEISQQNDDRILAESIARAVQADEAAIRAALELETQAHSDRQAALRLDPTGAAQTCVSNPATVSKESTSGNYKDSNDFSEYEIAKITAAFARLDIPDLTEDDNGAPGPSVPYNTRQQKAESYFKNKKESCPACTDEVFSSQMFDCPCGDRYCKTCIRQLFLNATKDESFFPPRCCKQHIATDDILNPANGYLTADQIDAFRASAEEFNATDKTYCHSTDCGKFISPKSIKDRDQALCGSCGKITCSICKKAAHVGSDCPEDDTLKQLQEVAEAAGWRSCIGCKRMVELTFGCDHMTCRCGAEFCYSCGAKWKTCRCDLWHPERLERRAAQIVDREQAAPFAPALPPVLRQQRVVQVQHEINNYDHDNCEHRGKWEKLEGTCGRRGYRCEVCEDRHWKFILQCRHCHLRACQPCRGFRT
ncbi:hypothetical protein BJ508DRAFT_207379 [Ascobolus immersus RN42]|uniref:RBR-type E3 ubiquitin transferase n=1 Tax=Ascobolus immersus RN42 TaxID=1160509 RepID=A0A3N4IAR9_ASCIM|nr:hypothetical protein BJ508DRAFT_207379 [Ascobolus immersus RN42]